MPSNEGRGIAKRAWDAYNEAAARYVVTPLFGSVIKSYSAGTVADLVGFWVLWHLHGGFEGLRTLGMSRASVFRKVAAFRRVFGAHPDEYRFPGISLDVAAYRGSAAEDAESQIVDKDD
jgi:hypothetical protein